MSAGLIQARYGYTKRSIRVKGEGVPDKRMGGMGDGTRHVEVVRDQEGTEYYRVEDLKDAAGEQWSDRVTEEQTGGEPIIKLKPKSVFHYTTRAGAEAILTRYGTSQARAVQQLMD